MRLVIVVALAFAVVLSGCTGGDDGFEGSGLVDGNDGAGQSGGDGERSGSRSDRNVLPAATAVPQFGSGEVGALVMGFAASSDHPVASGGLIPFANQVNEATGGAVTFEIFPDAQIVQNPGTFQSVVVGGQDIGWGVQALTAGRFPATSVVELPYWFDSATEATAVLWTLYDEFADVRNEYLDVKVLGLWVQDPGVIWSTTGPIAGADDLAPMAIGVLGPIQQDLIDALGSIGAPMLPSEVPGAFVADEISGVMASSSTMAVEDLVNDVAGGIDCRCFVAAEFLVMNLDTWDVLSPEQKAKVDEFSGRELSMRIAGIYDAERDRMRSTLTDGGVTVAAPDVTSPPWSDASAAVVTKWIDAGVDTRLPTQAMHDRMVTLTGP